MPMDRRESPAQKAFFVIISLSFQGSRNVRRITFWLEACLVEIEGCVYIAEMLLSSLCHLFDRVGNESRRIQLVVNECMKI